MELNEIEHSMRLADLIAKHLQERLSTAEQEELHTWLQQKPGNRQLFEELTNGEVLVDELKQLEKISVDDGWKKVSEGMVPQPIIRSIKFAKRKWWMAAAAIGILGSLWLTYQLTQNPAAEMPSNPVSHSQKTDIAPGGDRAILTLADGTVIELDSSGTGALANQGQVSIIKFDGKITYAATGASEEPVFNSISTPRGGQYQLELADGSKVWLNASSSLRFPSVFTGTNRVVEMAGECYFEIAHNPSKPFKVKLNDVEVMVTGTRFNVNGYADEFSRNITLAEGAVLVSKGNTTLKLKPGQQAQVQADGGVLLEENADMEETLAWKEGSFIFNSADVKTIMRQLSRWYNVEVAYQGSLGNETFSGIVSRQSNISNILKIMETGGVKFKMEGNTIIVSNQ
jgi:transmembrane sensor